jgi:hypothetical protein
VTAETQRLTYISEGEMEMVDYYPLRYANHNPPESNLDGATHDEPVPEIAVAYNDYVENGNGRTVAVTVSIRLPNATRCPHCEAVAAVPGLKHRPGFLSRKIAE